MLAVVDAPGREVFLGFDAGTTVLFYLLALVAIVVFLYGFGRRVRRYRRGRPAARLRPGGILRGLRLVASQRTVAKGNPVVGVAHFFVFWGFVVLLIGTTIIAIDEDLIGIVLRRPEWQFWRGPFYVAYALVLDVFGLGFIGGLLVLGRIRRRRPARLDLRRVDRPEGAYDRRGYTLDDRAFLAILLFLGVSGFLLEGFRIAATGFPGFERVSVAGWLVATVSGLVGERGNDLARVVTWWVHGGAALAFVAYIPYSKAMHIVLDAIDLMVTDPSSAATLPAPVDSAHPGYSSLDDLTWKELLDLDACTKCGRCHEVCPARTAGAPLSPRDLVLDLREHADAVAGIDPWYGDLVTPRPRSGELAGDVVAVDSLWACTTCMACQATCPVGIEHVPTIVQLRRRLVDSGEVEAGLQTAFQSLARAGNGFGKSAKQRARWVKGLDFKPKDARKEPVEYLWFLGDHAAFDPRAVEVSQAVARLFHDAGVDFGILYDAERNSGNDVRRAGEEGLFEMLREANLEALAAADFSRIVTTDPHSLNTLRGEYGLDVEVIHYTTLLDELIAAGAMRPGRLAGRATYHDPCYLGRYAGEYEAPRRLVRAVGLELVEMGRCRENSFCCGAGGGRIWMDDAGLAERPAENRIREAVALGDDVRYFVVACPKDMVMYSDAVKTTGFEDRLEVVDVAQLLARSLEAVGVG